MCHLVSPPFESIKRERRIQYLFRFGMSGFYSGGTAPTVKPVAGARPRTGGIAASFLDKINQKAKKPQEPDAEGYCTVVIERRHKGEALSELGLTLTPDAEVTSVKPNSRGSEANVPVHYIIFSVNDTYVETDAEFLEAASGAVRLIVKMYTAVDMKELLAKVQGEVMPDLEDLCKTALRYSFLKIDHPVHMRWNKRLEQCLEARRALQLMQAELDAAQRADEEREAERRLDALVGSSSDDEDEKKPSTSTTISPHPELAGRPRKLTSIVAEPVVDASSFGHEDVSKDELLAIISAAAPIALLKHTTPPPAPLTVGELRDIVGLPVVVPESFVFPPPPPTPLPSSSLTHSGGGANVTVLVRVKQNYKLSDGSVVSIAVKERRGPLPLPPLTEPPPLPEPAADEPLMESVRVPKPVPDDYVCHFCNKKGHWIDDCEARVQWKAKKEAPPLAPQAAAPVAAVIRDVCKDYQRGKCSRAQCIYRHVSPDNKKMSTTTTSRHDARDSASRDRKRSRSKRDRSRDGRSKHDKHRRRTPSRRRSRDDSRPAKSSRDEWSSRHKRL